MAFGSWFKNIVRKAGQFINKVKPYIGTAVKIAHDVVAPALSTIGNQVGGPVGTGLKTIGDATQKYTGRVMNKTNQWVPNERAKGFNMPLLKPC